MKLPYPWFETIEQLEQGGSLVLGIFNMISSMQYPFHEERKRINEERNKRRTMHF